MNSKSFDAVITPSGQSALVRLPFDPDEAWGRKPVHHVAGRIGPCGILRRARAVLPQGLPDLDQRDQATPRRAHAPDQGDDQAAAGWCEGAAAIDTRWNRESAFAPKWALAHDCGMGATKTKSSGKRGRQPDASSKSGKIRELLKTKLGVTEIAKKVGCTPALVYNVKARMANGKKRGPSRAPKSASARDGLAGILEAVKNSERERAQLRAALERLQTVIEDVLA